MEFIEKVSFLINEKGISKKKFLESIGAAKNSFAYWSKNGNIPNEAMLQKIADYFGVPVSTLFAEKEEKPTAGGELSENTKKLVEFAQSLTEEQAKIAIKLLKAIIEE